MHWRADVTTHRLFIAATLIAWGGLVWFSIELGSRARGGEQRAWWLMGATAIGAVACLFVALMLGARTLRTLERAGDRTSADTDAAGAAAHGGHSHAAPRHAAAPPPPPLSGNPYAVEAQGDTAERPRPPGSEDLSTDRPQAG